jgi:hypothetical protein
LVFAGIAKPIRYKNWKDACVYNVMLAEWRTESCVVDTVPGPLKRERM